MIAALWLAASLVALLFLERWMHIAVERMGLRLFSWPEKAMLFHAAIFLPGVALHEAAHWLTALMLGIPTGRFSLTPERQPDGSLRLGYVEVGQSDPLRGSLVGIAPLLYGAAAVIAIGYWQFNLGALAPALARLDFGAAWSGIAGGLSAWSLLWLYLLFAIANSMMPSPSDRRAWLPAAFILIALAIALPAFGLMSGVLQIIGGPVTQGMTALALAFSLAAAINLVVTPVIALAGRQAEQVARKRRREMGV